MKQYLRNRLTRLESRAALHARKPPDFSECSEEDLLLMEKYFGDGLNESPVVRAEVEDMIIKLFGYMPRRRLKSANALDQSQISAELYAATLF